MVKTIEQYLKVMDRVRLGWSFFFILGIPIFQKDLLKFFEGNEVMKVIILVLIITFVIFCFWSCFKLWPLIKNKKLTKLVKQDEFMQFIANKAIKVTAFSMYVLICLGFFVADYVDFTLKFAFGLVLYVTSVVGSITSLILNRD